MLPPPPPPPVIGTTGGTITETSGASVIFPAGAVSTDTTFRIAVDSTGAPAVPTVFGTPGNVYAVTPHGGDFETPVEVRIPAPAVTLQPNQQFKVAKAEPGGPWTILDDTQLVDGKLSVRVHDFSFFMGIVVTYQLPIAQAVPLQFAPTLVCTGGLPCTDLLAPTQATYSANGNNGQWPTYCGSTESTQLYVSHGPPATWHQGPRQLLTGSGGTITATVSRNQADFWVFNILQQCSFGWWSYSSGYIQATFKPTPPYPAVSVLSMPTQLDVVEGLPATLEAIVAGGALPRSSTNPNEIVGRPTAYDRAIVEWERSTDNGASWNVISRSFQNDGNAMPYGSGRLWEPWSVSHVFTATAADLGAMIRARVCYTPPAPTVAPPCHAFPYTRINVIQQSALPAIVEQPRSVLIRSVETANFSVSVSGLPAPTLQWQTRPANSTGEWTDVAVGTGPRTANYTTPPRVLSDNGVQYRVVVSNALGTVTSSPVTVSVSELDIAPSITTQPASLNLPSGGDAVFAAVAYGTEALSYQWRFNGVNIDGANSPILRLPQVTTANAGNYSLYVSNHTGNVSSNAATLQVTAGTPAAVAPSIVTQPRSVVANVGNTATFAVGVDGTGPLSFQWRRDGVNIPGANSASLTFQSVALPNAGIYSVVVSNSAGAVVSGTVTLDVHPAVGVISPSITSQPSTVIVPAGGSAMLAVGATGSGPLSYQWSFNGAAISGATLPVLSLTSVGNSDVGDYTVTVTNSVSSTSSQVAQLILLGAPEIQQDPASITAIQGQTATFSVVAGGSGLHYQWLLNGNPIPGATQASYTTPTLVDANTGAVYSVMVYNGAGLVTSQGAVLTVQVIDAPSVAQHPANATIQPGQTASLCGAFSGTFPMTLHLQRWNGTSWPDYLYTTITDNSVFCYSSPALTLAESGARFRFLAENAAGLNLTYEATITVTAPPPPLPTNTTLVSATVGGGYPEYMSGAPSISADGRLVAFTSQATNLIPEGTGNGSESGNAYLRDLTTGTATLINRNISGGVSSRGVVELKLSSNGRYVIFSSLADDLVENDSNGSMDIFRRDLQTGTTLRLNLLPNGDELPGSGNGVGEARLGISGDGRMVTFVSARNIATGGDGGSNDGYFQYVRDVNTGFTRYVDGNRNSSPAYVSMSDDGEWIAYAMASFSPVDMVTITLHDIEANRYYELFSYEQSPWPAGSRAGMGISADGRYVVFALNQPAITGSPYDQVMLVDRENPGVATVVSTGTNGDGDGRSNNPRISGDGRYVMFETEAPNLTSGQALSFRRFLMTRDVVAGFTQYASHRPNGSAVWVSDFGTTAISQDGNMITFVAGEGEMGGRPGAGSQVYAEPRR